MRFPWIASIFTLCGLAVLCTLGTWQLQRLEWKEQMLSQIEQGMREGPTQNILSASDINVQNLYQLGIVHGEFDHEYDILLGPKTMRDGLDTHIGFHLISPLRLEQGKNGQTLNVLVNRGFISQEDAKMIANTHIGGEAIISGMIAPIPRANMFTPSNKPSDGLWFSLNSIDVQNHMGDKAIAPNVLLVASLGDERLRSVIDEVSKPKNNHLQYAFFWFTMALALSAIYILRFVVPLLRQSS